MNVKKSQSAPFYIFRHCDTFRKPFFGFLKISNVFQVFRYFATIWLLEKPTGAPFTVFGIVRFFRMIIFLF